MRLLIALIASFAAAVPDQAAAPTAPSPRVKLLECRTGAAQADRGAAYRGRLRKLRGADRMQMRFTLRARSPEEPRWHSQAAPGLGVWHSSDSGVTTYEFVQRVDNLPAPGTYRVLVRFRWLDPTGKVIARASRLSATCNQPELRPNLVAVSFAAVAGSEPGTIRYTALVRNRGRSAAGPFDAVLTVNGVPQPAATVSGLAPGERKTVRILGPRCAAGSLLVLVLDARGQVDERNELDNQYSRTCPAGGVFGT